MLIINSVVAGLLLLSYLSSVISPTKIWIFAVIGLSYPFLLILNILFVIYWTLLLKRYFLLSLIVILVGYNSVLNQINFLPSGSEIKNIDKTLKVLSYNVRLFDFYEWIGAEKQVVRDDIVDFVADKSPDVVCIQEFFNNESNKPDNLNKFLAIDGINSYHVDYFITRRKLYHWGIATFSKYPIINRERFQFTNSYGYYCIITDIVKNSDTIRVFNVHFESWHFEHQDYEFLRDLKNAKTKDDTFISGIKNIYWKMLNSFAKRSEQAEELIKVIERSPYPVVVCGDFNDTPNSYLYGVMKRGGLIDSFREAGKGIGRTYIGKMPSFRIDYILHDNNFTAREFVTFKEELSDHYPVYSVLELE